MSTAFCLFLRRAIREKQPEAVHQRFMYGYNNDDQAGGTKSTIHTTPPLPIYLYLSFVLDCVMLDSRCSQVLMATEKVDRWMG